MLTDLQLGKLKLLEGIIGELPDGIRPTCFDDIEKLNKSIRAWMFTSLLSAGEITEDEYVMGIDRLNSLLNTQEYGTETK